MTNTYQKIAIFLLSIFIGIISPALYLTQGYASNSVASAVDREYSDVLDDLHKDSTFDESNYPAISDNYTLDIIMLAESVDDELFVYVYQPCGKRLDLRASSINISTTPNGSIEPYGYKLRYINSSGVFYKYVVEGLTVASVDVRYYCVTSIFRPFDASLGDKQADHSTKVDEVPFAISKEYRFSTINGKPASSVLNIDTILIKPESKFVGFVRYPDGFAFHIQGACDSHFIAFDTDFPIDKLEEATVEWVQQSYSYIPDGAYAGTTFGERKEDNHITLSIDDPTVTYKGDGFFAGSYDWKRIQTVDEFLSSMEGTIYNGALLDVTKGLEMTDDAKEALKEAKWVLRFTETDYEYKRMHDYIGTTLVATYDKETATLIGEVTILRLKFKTAGWTYNLGVIDNKQTGNKDPINNGSHITVKPSDEIESWWNKYRKIFIAVCGVIVLVVIIAIVIKVISIFKPAQKIKIDTTTSTSCRKRKTKKK